MGKYSDTTTSAIINVDANLKKRYYEPVLDPIIDRRDDDVYVICTYGERLDLLAWRYYTDATLWWIIAAANPEIRKDSLYIEPGTQVRVPINYQEIVALVNEQNLSR